ncbi:MAG: hypothetical protein ACYC8T_06975 [Myxococcaceae bacterium]
MRRLGKALALGVGLWCAACFAQGFSADRELEVVRNTFDVGNYREALKRCRDAMASQNFSEAQRMELNKYAGMAAFVLGDAPAAGDHLSKLLELNPDYVMDPFAFPPSAIQFFEELRKKNADTLNLVRQKIALREEQAKREAEERERARVAAEEQRRRLEQLAAQVTVRTVEKRSMALNFVPFGAGQFQQGRTGVGVALASAEGALAITSIIGYLAIESLKVSRTSATNGIPGTGTASHSDYGIPPERKGERDTWRLVKYGSAGAFWTVYAFGVVEAIYHHQDEVVTNSVDQVSVPPMPRPPSREGPSPAPVLRPSGDATPTPGPRPFLFPTSGGVGGGVTLSF